MVIHSRTPCQTLGFLRHFAKQGGQLSLDHVWGRFRVSNTHDSHEETIAVVVGGAKVLARSTSWPITTLQSVINRIQEVAALPCSCLKSWAEWLVLSIFWCTFGGGPHPSGKVVIDHDDVDASQ